MTATYRTDFAKVFFIVTTSEVLDDYFGEKKNGRMTARFRLKTKSTAYAVDFSMQKCHKPSIYLGLRHFLCYNRSIKVGDGDRTYDDFEYRKKT